MITNKTPKKRRETGGKTYFRLLVPLCFFLTLCFPISAQATWQSTLDDIQSATNQVMETVSNVVTTTVQSATNNFMVTVTNVVQSVGGGISATTATNIANSIVQSATNNLVGTVNNIVQSSTNGLASINYVNAATNGLVTASITNGLATTNFVLASQLAPAVIWSGVSGNTLAANSTHYAIPNNSTSMTATGQTNGVTSIPVTESITLNNLYVVTSGTVGSGSSHTSTLTIMTNGVATPITVNITGTTQTTGNDTTDSVTVPAGTTIGVRVVTGTSGSTTAVYWSWGFEGW